MTKFVDILGRTVQVGDIVAVSVSPGDFTPPALPIGRVTKISEKQTTVEVFKFSKHPTKTALLRHVKNKNGRMKTAIYQTPCIILDSTTMSIIDKKIPAGA